MHRQASPNSLPYVPLDVPRNRAVLSSQPQHSVERAEISPEKMHSEIYRAIFKLLIVSEASHRYIETYSYTQLHQPVFRPFMDESFFGMLDLLGHETAEDMNKVNELIHKIGGLPVKFAREDGQELDGKVTAWRSYNQGAWNILVKHADDAPMWEGSLTTDQIHEAYISATSPESDMIEQCPVDELSEF